MATRQRLRELPQRLLSVIAWTTLFTRSAICRPTRTISGQSLKFRLTILPGQKLAFFFPIFNGIHNLFGKRKYWCFKKFLKKWLFLSLTVCFGCCFSAQRRGFTHWSDIALCILLYILLDVMCYNIFGQHIVSWTRIDRSTRHSAIFWLDREWTSWMYMWFGKLTAPSHSGLGLFWTSNFLGWESCGNAFDVFIMRQECFLFLTFLVLPDLPCLARFFLLIFVLF